MRALGEGTEPSGYLLGGEVEHLTPLGCLPGDFGRAHGKSPWKSLTCVPWCLEGKLLVFDLHKSDSEMLVVAASWQDIAILVMNNSWLLGR